MSKQWTNKGWDVFIPGGGFSLRNCPDPVDNATRIVECVNACAGMSDPVEDIVTLKRQRDDVCDALERLLKASTMSISHDEYVAVFDEANAVLTKITHGATS